MILFPGAPRKYIHYLVGRFPNRVGLLVSPVSTKGWCAPDYYFPYAVDNGAFIKWNWEAFYKLMLTTRKYHAPMWVVVPDVVGDAELTMKMWHKWRDKVASFGYPLAFACQDGMEPQDVPRDAFCAFIGGTTEWKLENAHRFKGVCKWMHIGRVNGRNRLNWAIRIQPDSCDGTGWFRGGLDNQDNHQVNALIEYFEGSLQRGLFDG